MTVWEELFLQDQAPNFISVWWKVAQDQTESKFGFDRCTAAVKQYNVSFPSCNAYVGKGRKRKGDLGMRGGKDKGCRNKDIEKEVVFPMTFNLSAASMFFLDECGAGLVMD